MNVKGLKAACWAVGLATAWGSQANAGPSQPLDEIQLTITPSNNLSHGYFLSGTGLTTLNVSTVVPLPNLTGGISTTDTFFVNDVINFPSYYVIGLYDETNKLVTIGMTSSYAGSVIGNTDFNTQFSPFTENAIATALLSNDTATLSTFFFDTAFHAEIHINNSGPLVNFSNATDGGSLSATIVPEPSPSLLADFGALALVVFHRKQRGLSLFQLKKIRDP